MALASIGYASDRERVFIDANGDTGYYVYMDNVKRPGYYEVVADIAIIKADEDRIFIYETYFDTYHNLCRFQTSKVYQYSDKKMLMGSNIPQDLRSYTSTSPMKAIADYLDENTKKLIPPGALPIPPGEEEKEEGAEGSTGTAGTATKPGTTKPATKAKVNKKASSKTEAKPEAEKADNQNTDTKAENKADTQTETQAEPQQVETQAEQEADVQKSDTQQIAPQPEKDSSERQKTDEETISEEA